MSREKPSFDQHVIESAKEALTDIGSVNTTATEYAMRHMDIDGDADEFDPEELAGDQQDLYWELYSACQREIILQALTEL